MVIKPTWGPRRSGTIFGEKLNRAQLKELAASIQTRPDLYVGQEQLQLSTAPVLDGKGLRPRHLTIRCYLSATTASDTPFTMMPGGLTRIAANPDTLVVSMQQGGGSKDTWVLSEGPVSTFSLLPASVQPVALSRDGDDLPSRAADNLYWLGRYVDRIESIVRLFRGILVRATEQTGLSDVPEIPSLLRALNTSTRVYPGLFNIRSENRLAVLEQELFTILGDSRRAGSLAASVHALDRTARKVRDRLSLDMWRIIGTLVELYVDETASPGAESTPAEHGRDRDRDQDAPRRLRR